MDEKYGLINQNSKVILKPKYSEISPFNKFGLAIVENDYYDKHGVMDKNRGTLLECEHNRHRGFNEFGLAVVEDSYCLQYGFADKDSNFILESEYSEVNEIFSGDIMAEFIGDNKSTFVTHRGKIVDDFVPNIPYFDKYNLTKICIENKYGLTDKDGNRS